MNELNIDLIRTDGGTQPRAKLSQSIINEYTEEISRGVNFPPIIVYFDGEHYWLTDGFHRLAAMKKAGLSKVNADIRFGQLRDAILFSVGVNASHGLRRTNADKHRAVEIMLQDEEWCQWSDREIARRCAVSDRFVNNVRKEFWAKRANASAQASAACQNRKVIRNGKVYTVNTTNIGCSKVRSQTASSSLSISPPSQDSSESHSSVEQQSIPNVFNGKRCAQTSAPRIQVRCLDIAVPVEKETLEVFYIQSSSIQAEIVCTPSLMSDFLQHLRDYPSFVEALLKQANFCKEASA